MLSFVARVALSAVLATTALAQTFTINTPLSVVVCQPALLTWVGGTSPYFLCLIRYSSILPAGQPSAPSLLDLGEQSGNSVTWIANLAVGTSGFLNLRDNTGAIAQSGPFTVQSGTNISCVGGSIVTSAGPGGAQTTNTNTGSTAGSSSPTTGSASKTSSSTAAPTKSSAAAASLYAPVGAAAMIGAALFALAA